MVTTSTGNRDGRQGLSIGVGFSWGQAIVCSRSGRSGELQSWILSILGKHFISTALKYKITQRTRMTEAASTSEYFLILFSKLEEILGP